MKNKKIVKQLVRCLKRPNPRDRQQLNDLHLLVVTFLKRLSIHVENKAEMVSEQPACAELCVWLICLRVTRARRLKWISYRS